MARSSEMAGTGTLIVAVALTAAVLGLYGAWVMRHATGGDLAPLVIAARLIARGRADAIYAHEPGYLDMLGVHLWAATAQEVGYTDPRYYLYLYPPLWPALLAPFASDDVFETVLRIAGPLNLAAVGASVIIAAAQWNRCFLRPLPLLLCLIAVCFSYPLFRTMILGQMQPLVVLCVVAAITTSQSGRPRLAGALLAFGAAIKLVPAVIAVYWLFTGRRDAALWFGIAGAALAGLSLGLAGWDAHVAFIGALGRMSAGYAVGYDNQSLLAWLSEAAQHSEVLSTIPIRPAPLWARATVMLFAAGAIVALIRSSPRDRAAEALAAFGVFLVATIASPSAWLHYCFCLAVPLVVLARTPVGATYGLAIAVMLSMPIVSHIFRSEFDRAVPLTWGGAIGTLAVLALSAITVRSAARLQPSHA